MGEVTIRLWPDKRRVLLMLPAPADVVGADWLLALGREVCGPDAVVSGHVSGRLGGMAICACGDSQAWAREIGVEVCDG